MIEFTAEELKEIREDVWTTLDATQTHARSDHELLTQDPIHWEDELEEDQVISRQNVLKKIDKELSGGLH